MNKSKTKRYRIQTIKNGKKSSPSIIFGRNKKTVEKDYRKLYNIPNDVKIVIWQSELDYIRTKNANVQKGTSVRRVNKKLTAKGKDIISEEKYKADKAKRLKKKYKKIIANHYPSNK